LPSLLLSIWCTVHHYFPFFPGHRVLVLPSLLLSIWCSVHHYFPLLSWLSCFGVAQSFVVYMVYCPPLFPPSFLVIVFWCCPVFCCLYGVLSTIISPFFPGHRVLVLLSLLFCIWCSVHHYFPPFFLVIVFWCCPVFCCLYGVLSTIISPFFPGHRVLVLPSLLLSIWCSVHHYFPILSWSSCFGVAQSFVVYKVFCPPLFPPFFPGHRVLVLLSLLLSI
jgi:hypothetical protein